MFGGLGDVNTAAAWWLLGGTVDGWVEGGDVYGCSSEEIAVLQFSNSRIYVGRQGEWRVSLTLDGRML